MRIFCSRSLFWVLGIGFILCAVPLLVGALCAFPAADDFVYATRTHRTWVELRSLPHVVMDALRYAAQIYRNWQGTFFGALVMALNPAVVTLSGYFTHAWVVLLAFSGALWALTQTACTWLGMTRRQSATAFFALWILSWGYLPDLREGLYWFNAAWFYTMAHVAWMAALTLALRLPGLRGGARRMACVPLWVICAALGLDNYITAMLALFSLVALCAIRWRADKTALLIGIALLAAGLAISVLAPGNAVRVATETQHPRTEPWLPRAALLTVLEAARMAFRFLFGTPLLACCALVTPWLYRALGNHGRAFCHPLVAVAAAFAGLCAMIFPHMFAAGYAGPSRVINLYFLYCVLAVPACVAYCAGAVARRLRGRAPGKELRPVCGALAVCLLAVSLALGAPFSFASLASDLANGSVFDYRRQTLAQFDALAAAQPGSDAVLPASNLPAPAVAFVPFSADPTHWANQALADYFGLRTVRQAGD